MRESRKRRDGQVWRYTPGVAQEPERAADRRVVKIVGVQEEKIEGGLKRDKD